MPDSPASQSDIRILCADDDPGIQLLYRRYLEKRGYQVVCCGDGQAVLDAFDSAPSNLVILDLNMPGMSGMDTLVNLRRRLDAFNVPIIIVSAEDSEEIIVDGLSSGADEFIIKPFKSSELLAKVAIALRKRQASEFELGLAMGSRFAGRYEIGERVGQGGFSTVYQARDTHSEIPLLVALKVFDLPPSKRNDRQFMSAFLREAYEHSKLDHPNIIALYDFGQIGGYYFMVTEFIDGQTLEKYMSEEGVLSEFRALYVCYQMTKALAYLDKQGLVHRDIKPANIMLTADGDVKLLDFGLAKKPNEHTLSLEDEFRGTPQFVSPEYIRDEPLTIASDIYSLGGTVYYLVSSLAPMRSGSTIDILKAHLNEAPIPIEEVEADLDPAFADLINRMLAKLPAERPMLAEILDTCRKLLFLYQEKTQAGF